MVPAPSLEGVADRASHMFCRPQTCLHTSQSLKPIDALPPGVVGRAWGRHAWELCLDGAALGLALIHTALQAC